MICDVHQGCFELSLPNAKVWKHGSHPSCPADMPCSRILLLETSRPKARLQNDTSTFAQRLTKPINLCIHQQHTSYLIIIYNLAVVSPAPLVSSFSASAALASAFSPTPEPPIFATTPLTTSRVAAGPPGSAARTSPSFLTTKTPRVVPLGAFFRPIASMSEAEGSHSRGYGSFCLSLNVVFALGESVLRP